MQCQILSYTFCWIIFSLLLIIIVIEDRLRKFGKYRNAKKKRNSSNPTIQMELLILGLFLSAFFLLYISNGFKKYTCLHTFSWIKLGYYICIFTFCLLNTWHVEYLWLQKSFLNMILTTFVYSRITMWKGNLRWPRIKPQKTQPCSTRF